LVFHVTAIISVFDGYLSKNVTISQKGLMLLKRNGMLMMLSFSIFLLFIISLVCVPKIYCVYASSISPLELDVFVEKSPNDGQEPNQSADSYFPLEQMMLTANVSYNQKSVEGFPVSFQVDGPKNPSGATHFFRVGFTNQSGQVILCFTLPSFNSSLQVVGTWTVSAFTKIGEETASDSLTFEVVYKKESNSELSSLPSSSSFQGLFILVFVVVLGLLSTLLLFFLRKRRKSKNKLVPHPF
jgi:hypothetical protein